MLYGKNLNNQKWQNQTFYISNSLRQISKKKFKNRFWQKNKLTKK